MKRMVRWLFAGLAGLILNAAPMLARSEEVPYQLTSQDQDYLRYAEKLEEAFEQQGLSYRQEKLENRFRRSVEQMLGSRTLDSYLSVRVRLFRDSEKEAFSLGNGSIYLSFGLVAHLENEGQLHGMIAHELAHVLLRHHFQAYREWGDLKSVFNSKMIPGAPARSNAIYHLALKNYPLLQEQAADQLALELLAGAGGDRDDLVAALERLKISDEPGGGKRELSQLLGDRGPEIRLNFLRGSTATTLPAERDPALRDHAAYVRLTIDLRHRAILQQIRAKRFATARAVVKGSLEVFPDDPRCLTDLGVVTREWAAYGLELDQIREQAEEEGKTREEQLRKQKGWAEETVYSPKPRPEKEDPYFSIPPPRLSEAEPYFQRALARDPNYALAYKEAGRLYELMGRDTEAAAAYGQYLKTNPAAREKADLLRRIQELSRSGAADGETKPPAPSPGLGGEERGE